ncbi:MAG: flavodoxin family protein [Chloroflexi bacterium]|nr:flavodoxin family protein [Chloroflexota bacterium]
MKVLGIVASHRRLGNTEILVKEALMGAEEQGAKADILRWTDYHILPCDGLATCLFGGTGCALKDKDDHNYLLEKIYECDGLIFGAPCYLLEVPAIVRRFIDRLFVLMSSPPPTTMRQKPAAIIIPYATRGWTSYAFLQPNLMMLELGMAVIDRALIHIQGMSEATDNQRALDRAHKIGITLAQAIKTGDVTYRGEPGICPICHDRNIHILKDNQTVECGLCGIRGKLSIESGKIKVHFPEEQVKWHRFSEENIYRHFTYEIKPSKDYFIKTWPLLKEKRRKYRDYLRIDREPVIPEGRG